MSVPLILIVGPAGSGKDEAANVIVSKFNGVKLAFSDPIKRFAANYFGFSKEQLWGPSLHRNQIDSRFALERVYNEIELKLYQSSSLWVREVLPKWDLDDANDAKKALYELSVKMLHQAMKDGGLTPRKTLQTLGTEWGRRVCHPDIWVDYAVEDAFVLLKGKGLAYFPRHGIKSETGSNRVYDFTVISDGRHRNEVLKIKRLGGKIIRIKNLSEDSADVNNAGIKNHDSEMEINSIPESWFDAIIHNDKKYGLESLSESVSETVQYLFQSTSFYPTEILSTFRDPTK